ncbi:hypothetical protein GCM10009527_025810 [Actinomadura nitritigenes]
MRGPAVLVRSPVSTRRTQDPVLVLKHHRGRPEMVPWFLDRWRRARKTRFPATAPRRAARVIAVIPAEGGAIPPPPETPIRLDRIGVAVLPLSYRGSRSP